MHISLAFPKILSENINTSLLLSIITVVAQEENVPVSSSGHQPHEVYLSRWDEFSLGAMSDAETCMYCVKLLQRLDMATYVIFIEFY